MKSEETVNPAEESPDKVVVTQEAESAEPDNNEKKINTDLKENVRLLMQFWEPIQLSLNLAGVGSEYQPLSHDWEPRIKPNLTDLRKIMGSLLEAREQFYLF